MNLVTASTGLFPDLDPVIITVDRGGDLLVRAYLATDCFKACTVERRVAMKYIFSTHLNLCGLCGNSGADCQPAPPRWPGERTPGTAFVHGYCQGIERERARSLLTPRERELALEGGVEC